MKLLFITQKLHGQDAFGILWIRGFIERGYEVEVICLEWRPEEAKKSLGVERHPPFHVYSLGKENGAGKLSQIRTFWKLIHSLSYDRVFIHMSPVWGLLGAPTWTMRKIPVYLWYTHYKMQVGLFLLGIYAKRLFCATPQSLPHYNNSEKKVVTGHGIDVTYWPKKQNTAVDSKKLLVVHRLSRSKRLELILEAMVQLPEDFTLDIYGIDAEKDYADRMRMLTGELGLSMRVTFHGSLPMHELPNIYTKHRFILNMASETIDKTMLEAMTCGCYPITTLANAHAIGLPIAPANDTPTAIAQFVLDHLKSPLSADELYTVVRERHSLQSLIERMDTYIRPGV